MERKEGLGQSEEERLKRQIRSMEKLASLGMLSAGIAHEIQNPLNFVINFSKMSCRLLVDLEEVLRQEELVLSPEGKEEIAEIRDTLNENLKKIEEHGDRAISIVRGILLYSRGKENEFVETDVRKLVKEYVWLAYHAIRAGDRDFNIAIREEYSEEIPLLKLVPQDFSRVIVNLVNNACYAVKAKKKLKGEEYRPEIGISLKAEGKGIVLSIADNGIGMTEEVKQKVFMAFFTTKPVGEGTGLGLSIVRSIVEEVHQGKIELESEAGEGTRFVVRIGL